MMKHDEVAFYEFVCITAGFLYRAGSETPLNFREKFRVSPRTILIKFSAVDTQTAVLVSTAEVWISAPDAQTPTSLCFLGYTQLTLVFLSGEKNFGYFPEMPVTKMRVSAPAPYKKPTVTVSLRSIGRCWCNKLKLP